MDYENKLKRLEEIVQKLENGKIGLQESTELFEEGVKLSKELKEILVQYKGKITQIKEDLNSYIEENMN